MYVFIVLCLRPSSTRPDANAHNLISDAGNGANCLLPQNFVYRLIPDEYVLTEDAASPCVK